MDVNLSGGVGILLVLVLLILAIIYCARRI